MKRVLLTGATGLIGKYAIQPLLDAGFEVFAVSTKSEKEKGQSEKGVNVFWIQANLLDFSDVKKIFEQVKPQYLLHFAWDTTPGTYLESNLNYKWLDAGLQLLKEFKSHGGKRAVFAGTCFEYEFKNEPLKEDAKTAPKTLYAKCKDSLHQQAQLYCKNNDISFGWGRIFYVYGEGEHDKRLFPNVINSLKSDKEVIITVGNLVKDYIFAADIAGAFVKFLDTNVQDVINICSGKAVTIKEIVSLIAKKMGKEHLVHFEDKPSKEPEIILGDNFRLLNEVGYHPRFTMDEALDILIDN